MKRFAHAAKNIIERLAYAGRAEEEEVATANARPNAAKLGGFRHVVLCREFLERGGHGLRPTQGLLLMLLANYADEHGRCYPSRKRLADGLGIHPRSVSSALRVLIDRKFVEILSRGYGQGDHGTNFYQLRTPGSGWPSLTLVDKVTQASSTPTKSGPQSSNSTRGRMQSRPFRGSKPSGAQPHISSA